MATYLKSLSTLRSLLDSHSRVEDESTWIHGPTTKEPKEHKHETCSMTCGDIRRRRWWVHPVIGGVGRPPYGGTQGGQALHRHQHHSLNNLGPTCQRGWVSRPTLLARSRSVSPHRLSACLTHGSNPHHPSMAVPRGGLSKG